MVNTEGFINFANQYMTEMFGFKLQELIGMPYFDLIANKERTAAETNLVNLIKGEIDHTFVERQYQRNDGSVFWGNLSGTRILNEDSSLKGLIGVITDITDHKMDADALKESLNEKDTLLREIHHRVKNNMQIISSLLNLQMHHEDLDETVNVLKESQGRVKSMAMIHEKLYQSPNFTDINFKDYIDKLIFDIFYSYGIKIGTIESVLDIEDINLNIETAIPLGLIVNELVTNSVKYAFPKGEGIITIHLKSLQDKMELTIADNGIGLPKDIDIDNTEILGLQLVKSLVNQIGGKIELDQTHGTEFKIIFKEVEYNERI
jgi:PAS domain S-box-containing protein